MELEASQALPQFTTGMPYGGKRHEFVGALRRAFARGPHSLNTIAEKLIECAADGQGWAIQEIANRLDGKPTQAVEVSGNETLGAILAMSHQALRQELDQLRQVVHMQTIGQTVDNGQPLPIDNVSPSSVKDGDLT